MHVVAVCWLPVAAAGIAPLATGQPLTGRRRQFGPETYEETEHHYEVQSSDDAGYVDGRGSMEAQDGQDQL
jgi:hypothetical protein